MARSTVRFGVNFGRLVESKDGQGLHDLLKSTETGRPEEKDLQGVSANDIAADVVRAWKTGVSEAGLDALVAALRKWCSRYLVQKPPCTWMLSPMLWFTARLRKVCRILDHKGKTEKYTNKLVEALREQFQLLRRGGREGALAVCCELLRLYVHLGQVSQCTFLLSAVCPPQNGAAAKPDVAGLPRSLSVTLYFLWGKHCVLGGNVAQAEEMLGWALANCPPACKSNRRRILAYLVPCRLRLGRFPKRGVLERNGLERLGRIAAATASGDIRLFNKELAEQEEELIQLGTFLVVEKLKLVAYRNLARGVYDIVAEQMVQAGKPEQRFKQDLTPYERAFRWQDDCDADESLCILARLVYIGAIRGYISEEHRKLVFSKDAPFPPVSSWGAKV